MWPSTAVAAPSVVTITESSTAGLTVGLLPMVRTRGRAAANHYRQGLSLLK